mmetsp:Transcript_9687/g.16805  ORF Transcript_9687/g.16805 Transcript_9687/m.16805 type:complete len:461 (+) Transcript_9687:80-1462(+)|eukprot:CAMPEP_0196656420 /NCGR_PEP_ID=MMETSP1086-20130531/17053_1 /TAXON_ID=77921 /ORGANISM="Cyanoptyche  gloeocystis , Strain SAG4.97" /LENGTH=460 /DNA_ID=CAMNT_0041989161 /DNA_START=76 /DNA_END=1458 /DNA_ORIENTATION=+
MAFVQLAPCASAVVSLPSSSSACSLRAGLCKAPKDKRTAGFFYGETSSAFHGKHPIVHPIRRSEIKFEVVSQQQGADAWGDSLAQDSMAGNDQMDIRRGRGMVSSVFQGKGVGAGSTHVVVNDMMEYHTTHTRSFNNIVGDFYICPAFMDKIVLHITKNFLVDHIPKIKVPLILGIWGGKGNGKSFQCELVFKAMGIECVLMSSGELEDASAGEPAKLIRTRYREAADIIRRKGKMAVLMINDLDAGAGRMGATTQYTVNNQMVNATLMNIADNPTNVQLPGMYNQEEIPRVPIVVTGNDFATLYAPLIRDGRMEKFFWAPTRDDKVGICHGIFKDDEISKENVGLLVDTFPSQSIDFFGAIRSRVYDDEIRTFISGIGVENIGKRVVNSKEKLPEFTKPHITVDTLISYGHKLEQEQALVRTVKLAESYVSNMTEGPSVNKDALVNTAGQFFDDGSSNY